MSESSAKKCFSVFPKEFLSSKDCHIKSLWILSILIFLCLLNVPEVEILPKRITINRILAIQVKGDRLYDTYVKMDIQKCFDDYCIFSKKCAESYLNYFEKIQVKFFISDHKFLFIGSTWEFGDILCISRLD